MSVEEGVIEEVFSLYPNPSTDLVTIKLNGQLYRGNYRITDALGRMVVGDFTTGSVDVSVLPPGAYVITVTLKASAPHSLRLLRP